MDDGMRLKSVEGSVVLSRAHNIHNNGPCEQINSNTTIGDKLSNSTLIYSKQWINDYESLEDNGNYKLTDLKSQDYNYICQPNSLSDSPVDDIEVNSGSSSSSSSPGSSPEAEYRSISESDSEEIKLTTSGRGIVNPNYPGFQDFANQLISDSEDESTNNNDESTNNNDEHTNNNDESISNDNKPINNNDTSVNQNSEGSFQKNFYDKPKFKLEQENGNKGIKVTDLNIVKDDICIKLDNLDMSFEKNQKENKMADAFLSGVKEDIQKCEDSNHNVAGLRDNEETIVPKKKEKMEINYNLKMNRTQPVNGMAAVNIARQQTPARNVSNRRFVSTKKRPTELGSFDVYNIETAMPKIDLDAIESHLRAAREEDRRRRNDREEIRRRLATGCDGDEYYGNDRPGRKPSLQARLQSGMNLQICFMNDTMSDTESPSNEVEPTQTNKSPVKFSTIETVRPEQKLLHFNSNITANQGLRGGLNLPLNQNNELQTEADFFMNQARLQAEARVALAQAKDMARLQMEMDRQRKQMSPITEMLRQTLHKVGVKFPQDRRRVSRQMLTDMNVAQLQVIVNDLHSQIEYLNESLVKLLMERDDLHMSQDSMLVDIEDLTRYLGAKENMFKEDLSQNNNVPTKPKINRIASLIRK
uniref:Schwannomin interacting protein 1 C-terminal domain-containing protein n=1 Tax=Clastoptera arizonana TaxID=38151 RepID=A0A1B6CHL0_9HEMI